MITKDDLNITVKNIPITYIELDGNEFPANKVRFAVDVILENTKEDDVSGDYSLRDYELYSNSKIYKVLVKLGLVKNFRGHGMADLYCIAKGKTKELENLRDILDEL